MRKFIVKKTGEPIELGKVLRRTEKKDFSFGSYESVREDLITEANVGFFIKNGILEEITNKVKPEVPTDVNYYILQIAKKMNHEVNAVYEWLDLMNKSGYEVAVLNMLLKEIKSVLNHNYKEVPPVKWFINVENGEVYYIKGNKTKYISCFYSKEDAELAKRIVARQLQFMGINNG